MATDAQKLKLIDDLKTLAELVKKAKSFADQVQSKNSEMVVDWNGSVGAALVADTEYSGTDIANAIGSLAALTGSYWTTNGGNLERFCRPLV